MEFLWFILIGIAAGWLAGQFMKGGGFGLFGDLIVGVIGALLGGWLFGMLGIAAVGLIGQLVVATIGAIVLILLLRLCWSSDSCVAPLPSLRVTPQTSSQFFPSGLARERPPRCLNKRPRKNRWTSTPLHSFPRRLSSGPAFMAQPSDTGSAIPGNQVEVGPFQPLDRTMPSAARFFR